MEREKVINDYFEWLCGFVCLSDSGSNISHRKLLMFLHSKEFMYTVIMDKNRASDGRDMRYRFVLANEYERDDDVDLILSYLEKPCSVLEMMVALAIRCEENIMDNVNYGNRTGEWFWRMITSLGIQGMYDDNFDKRIAEDAIHTFLNRNYKKNGKGGLFTVKNCNFDMRDVEIWCQMCWYLDTIY